MEETLRQVLSITIGLLCALFGAGCLSILAVRFWRWVPMVALWRLKRTTIVVLFAMSIIATIEAQKRTGGDGTSGSPSSQTEPDGGDAEPPPLRDALTNTLHFAAISTGTNAVSLTLAWPPDLFASGTVLDLFAATSLVETVWDWQCAHTVADGETNWTATVARDGAVCFFHAAERADPGDLRDTDGDGIPDVYELHNGTNPYVPDYAAAPKLTVGPSGAFGTIEAAVEASAAYSIVELDPSVSHEVGGQSLGCRIPLHPIMVTAPRPYAVVRSEKLSAFMLATNTTSQTLFRNLYLLLDAKDSFQTGFWCGGNLPMSSVPASATFQSIYVRMPNPGVQYRGWLFYAKCADRVSILGCTLNAAGATWVTGIDAYDSPPITMDGCSFVNFPSDSADGNSCGILLRTSSLGGGTDVTLSRTLFDESFIDAWPLGRFDSASPCSVSASGCILPCPFPMEYPPDVVTNLTVTNAALAWVGVPRPDSPSVALGVGSLAPIGNDPTVDTDGDGLADYDEAYDHGTDPYLADSDNDGETDWNEIHNGTDPTDPHSFTQTLTMTATNTVSPSPPVLVAWGFSEAGWETNGLTNFPSGSGTVTYTNASFQGATHIKAFCDLNENGEYDADWDILLVREIPHGSTAQISFAFGDVDGDGVSDIQERTDGTDPHDAENFRMVKTVIIESFDIAAGLTNYVAWGLSANGWETNGLSSFSGGGIAFPLDVVAMNGDVYVKVFRDINANGVYDVGIDPLVVRRLTKTDNIGSVTVGIGDGDHDGVSDTQELADGTDPCDARNFRMEKIVTIESFDVMVGQTNYVAWGLSANGWNTNGLSSFGGGSFAFPIEVVVTNGEVYVKVFRDFNANGLYDDGIDALVVQRLTTNGNDKPVTVRIGDSDHDGVSDSVELNEGTDPVNDQSYCFSMSATVTGIFQTTNRLTMVSTFGDTALCGPVMMTTNIWSADFGHLLATNGEKVVLTFWDDANSNGIHDVSEAFSQRSLPVTNHSNICTLKLPYGGFDADGNNLPDWWEVATGLAEYDGPHGEFDDADGDGLINLHEYWAGCDPLVPDGSNTLLSVVARSIDDRIINAEPGIAMPKFVDYASNGSNGVFALNTNCWAVDIDTSCASMWQSYAPTAGDEMRRAATLISPRHVIGALHYPQIGGSQCWFRGKSGMIYVRTLLRSVSLSQPNTDIRIGLLNEELPTNDVSPVAILPVNCHLYVGDGTRLPCLVVDQEEKMIVQDIQPLPSQPFTSLLTGMRPMNNRRNSFYEDVMGGDSSSPRFLVIENRVVLLNVMWKGGGGGGSFVTLYKDLIQNAMDSLCSGFQLETIDLTTYQPLDTRGVD